MVTRYYARTFLLVLLVCGWVCLSAFAQPEETVTIEEYVQERITAFNAAVEEMGEEFRVGCVEYHTAEREAGQIIYANDRTLRMGLDWVPADPRRGGFTELYWLSDMVDGIASGVLLADTQDAVSRAMETWNSQTCATIPLVQLTGGFFDIIDWGYLEWLESGAPPNNWGGSPLVVDIMHAGWLPGNFFESVFGPGTSSYVLGMTVTWHFINVGDGSPTDIDGNRMADIAFSETYYNNAFPWGVNTHWPIDVESVVLHEAGHSLGLDHFGRLFSTDANGKLHFAPLAVMNAGYTGMQHELAGTDTGAFCSLWATWPQK